MPVRLIRSAQLFLPFITLTLTLSSRSGDGRSTLIGHWFGHTQYKLLEGPAGAVILGMAAFEGKVELQEPAIELAGPVAAKLNQTLFGRGQVAERPIAKAGGGERLA